MDCRRPDVGGAATHIAGYSGDFRALGLRIGLVTTEPPPAQLAPVLDAVDVVSPLPRGARLTTDIEEVALNRAIRDAATSLGQRLGPSLVYQRHRQFLWAGAHVSRTVRAPLVLEWNNSEVWFRANVSTATDWQLVTPIVQEVERSMLHAADLTPRYPARCRHGAGRRRRRSPCRRGSQRSDIVEMIAGASPTERRHLWAGSYRMGGCVLSVARDGGSGAIACGSFHLMRRVL